MTYPDQRIWISRSDYDELERRCDGLEREITQARELVAACNRDGGQYQERHGFRRACRQAQCAVAGAWTELEQAKSELATLNAQLDVRAAELTKKREQAAALARWSDDIEQRIATIAYENFGPFPVQSAEDNMTAIERGIFDLRQKRDALERQLAAFKEASKIREELQCAENEQLCDLRKENDRLRAELNRRPRVVSEHPTRRHRKIELLRELLGDERDGTLVHIGETETLGYYADALEAIDREGDNA